MRFPIPTRRTAVMGAVGLAACAVVEQAQSPPAELRCADLTAPPPVALTPVEQERHAIFLLLSMALVFDGWGVNRQRPDLLAAYADVAPGRTFPDYHGHNVGALLVDGDDRIICFALNRNVALNSTLEHAEARSVRTAIDIANVARPPLWSFGQLLQSDRLYATLEPCAQCAGIMDLANISTIIFGQADPGQHHIVNVLYNLRQQARAPLPIRATFLPVWDQLDTSYREFLRAAPPGSRTGLTSYLETVEAYLVFRDTASAFQRMRAEFAVNAAALEAAQGFRSRWQRSVHLGLVPTAVEHCERGDRAGPQFGAGP